jgi:hypothetical protein
VSLRKVLGKVLVLSMLEVGALAGVPIRPEEVQEMMTLTNRAAHLIVRDHDGDGDGKDRKPPNV